MANIDQLTLFDTGENVNRRARKPDVLKNIEFMDLESIVRQLGKHRNLNERQYIHLTEEYVYNVHAKKALNSMRREGDRL